MRNYKIVNLRAIAIITVVIGHSIILYSSKWNLIPTNVYCPFLDRVKDIINLYQMQLYFFISGFLMYYTLKKKATYYSFLKNKAQRLLLPYMLFGFFWMLPIKYILQIPTFQGFSVKQLIYRFILGIDNGHLWFLYSLFLIFLVLYILNRYLPKLFLSFKNEKVANIEILLICIGLIIANDYIHECDFNVKQALQYAFWFQLGISIQTLNLKIFIVTALFCLLSFVFIDKLLIVSLCILLALYYLMPNKTNKFLSVIDKNSFGIYLLHSPLIYITYTYFNNSNPIIVFSLNFFIMGGIAFVLTMLIKKSGLKIV